MKKIIKIIVVIIALLMVVSLTGLPKKIFDVAENFESKMAVSEIIGRWERENSKGIKKLEFFSDGTYASDHPNYNGNYSIDGHRLKLSGILVDPLVYSFEIKNNELNLIPDSGETRTFTKIKE